MRQETKTEEIQSIEQLDPESLFKIVENVDLAQESITEADIKLEKK